MSLGMAVKAYARFEAICGEHRLSSMQKYLRKQWANKVRRTKDRCLAKMEKRSCERKSNF